MASEATVDYEALARTAADRLQGSCRSIDSLGEEFEGADNVMLFCETLDSLVFLCTECGWWDEISDQREAPDGQWICSQCAGEY